MSEEYNSAEDFDARFKEHAQMGRRLCRELAEAANIMGTDLGFQEMVKAGSMTRAMFDRCIKSGSDRDTPDDEFLKLMIDLSKGKL